MNPLPTLCFATSNKGKIIEIQKLLIDKYIILGNKEIGCLEEIPETGDTIEENSQLKAMYIWENYKVNCFADDTGLEVRALNNEPGVYSARYAGTGISEDNINLLLNKLKDKQDPSAQFKTIITLVINGNFKKFEGIATGKIIQEKRGQNGFGYDPIFVPSGYDCTFAEMSIEEKNKISHRAKAVRSLIDYLASNPLI
ncbi:MAG: RdgB/HAM1 family non-canonical purine NTP pyrophosphatase [Cytophagales bacterium]|nr:MAG: RdgB/HAM1 family non-canonical purine NTP pyrophosphatase [Cytophagales bacterium]